MHQTIQTMRLGEPFQYTTPKGQDWGTCVRCGVAFENTGSLLGHAKRYPVYSQTYNTVILIDHDNMVTLSK